MLGHDRCDFRCACCMAEDMLFLPKQDLPLGGGDREAAAATSLPRAPARLVPAGPSWDDTL